MGNQPIDETLNLTETRRTFSQLVNDVYRRKKRVIVEKNGIPVAAVISSDDLKRLQQLDEQRERDFAVIDEIRAAFADVPEEEIERELAKAIAEVRQERRYELIKQRDEFLKRSG